MENTAIRALLNKAAKTTDSAARYKLLHQAEEMAMKDSAVIPLLYYNEPYLQSDKVKNSWHTSDGFWHFQYADIVQ